ncbi:hypothetical protein [Streptomyces sp. MZ04]|uniref:hypothetical protein n=1 Tax=Streptomyces sp. MZ04 TaxID=2559236 RepID=UPI00107E76CA|nr:hypothetical protein [Streptomyces sp. MZ04]TGB09779.1 hypothetical protein E2651_15630 [Streptomyces sp. MZ04]
MTKTVTLADAEQQLTAATATLDQLKAKILDQGPGTVTAEELGTAALAVEHARLAVGHAAKQAEDQTEQERQEHLHDFKADTFEKAGTVEGMLDAMQKVAEGTAYIVRFCAGRQQLVSNGINTLRREGVPQASEGAAEQHAGLAWSDASAFGGPALHADGRRIAGINAGLPIAAAVTRGCAEAGKPSGWLGPVLQVPQTGELADNPETWLRARY